MYIFKYECLFTTMIILQALEPILSTTLLPVQCRCTVVRVPQNAQLLRSTELGNKSERALTVYCLSGQREILRKIIHISASQSKVPFFAIKEMNLEMAWHTIAQITFAVFSPQNASFRLVNAFITITRIISNTDRYSLRLQGADILHRFQFLFNGDRLI